MSKVKQERDGEREEKYRKKKDGEKRVKAKNINEERKKK
jgi:hypothetical protein